jgi:hypothetical protein
MKNSVLTDSSVDMIILFLVLVLGEGQKGGVSEIQSTETRAWTKHGHPRPRLSRQPFHAMGPRSAMYAARPVKATQPSVTSRKGQILPRKDIPVGDRVQRLFTSLCAQIDGSHFTNAIKTCDKGMCLPIYQRSFRYFLVLVLRLVPDDEDAKQTKLFLLLQTERYIDALALLGDSNESSAFERAYSLYRLQRLDEAAQLIDGIKQRQNQNRGALHLEAQLVNNLSALMRNLGSSSFRIIGKAIIKSLSTCTTSSSTHPTR